MKKRNNHRYTKGLLRGMSGVLLFLFTLLLALSPATHLSFLCYPLIAFCGYIGFISLLLLGFFFGATLPFKGKVPYPKARFYLGLSVLVFGLCLLSADLGAEGKESLTNFDLFATSLNGSFSSGGFAFLSQPVLCGGFIGFLFASLLSPAGRFLPILVSILISLFGLFLLFLPLEKKAWLRLRAKGALKKARDGKKGEATLDVGEEDPGFAYHEKMIPQSSEEEREKLLSEEKKAIDEWDFKPSSSLSYSSRSDLRKEKEDLPLETAGASKPSSRPVDTYFRGGVLQEPVFDFLSKKEEAKEEKEEKPLEEATLSDSLPQSTEKEEAPSPKDPPVEETPIEEAQSAENPPLPETPELVFPTETIGEPSPVPPVAIPLKEEPQAGERKEEEKLLPVEEKKEEAKKEENENSEDAPETPLPSYVFPDESLLDDPTVDEAAMALATQQAEENMQRMNETLSSFSAGASVISFKIGPSVTRYDVKMEPGVQVNSISRYETDLSAALAGLPARFVPIVKDRTTSAFEIGNRKRMPVAFKEVFTALPKGEKYNMVIPFGKSIDGDVVYGDLSSFPHMLVAGTTGSGKSIFLHNMLLALLMRNRPEDLRLLVVDPKQVEFTVYDALPNLLCPAITSAEEANVALGKLAEVMDRRFEMLRKARVRDIRSYNSVYAPANHRKRLPFIVVVIDEFADLAMQCKDVAEPIQRLGQKGRACGIHMIVATQRPDANTISGTIKANLPVTVCLMVKNSTDSQVVLKSKGGEALLNHGDMLVDCPQLGREFVRCQCAMVEEQTELAKVPEFIRSQMKPNYDPFFMNLQPEQQVSAAQMVEMPSASMSKAASDEEKYEMIKRDVMTQETTSISQVQRTYGVGFPKAGRIVARLQNEGIVAKTSDAPGSSKGFRVLVHTDPNPGGVKNGDTPGSVSSASTSYSFDEE